LFICNHTFNYQYLFFIPGDLSNPVFYIILLEDRIPITKKRFVVGKVQPGVVQPTRMRDSHHGLDNVGNPGPPPDHPSNFQMKKTFNLPGRWRVGGGGTNA
jgi:hypothetical protein